MPLQSPKMQFVLDANGDPMITEFKKVTTAIVKLANNMAKTQERTRSAAREFNKFKGAGNKIEEVYNRVQTAATRNAHRQRQVAQEWLNSWNNIPTAADRVAEAQKKVAAETKRAAMAAKESVKPVSNLRDRWQNLVGVFLGVGGAIAIAHQAFYRLTRLFRDIIDTTVRFEESMNRVRAVTGAINSEFRLLNNQAKQLGSTTRFTATQVAQGQGFLGQAGFDSFEVLEATPAVLRLSSAGMLEMARAGDILTNIMGGFGLATSEAARATDVLAAAATSSNTSIEQLGEGLKFAAPVAHELGISLERTTALMGILGNQGLQATVAGVGLRQVMLSLIGPTSGAQKIFDKYNITLKDSTGRLREVIDIIDDLKAANAEADEFAKIFDRRGATIALAISNYTDEVRELTKALELSYGAADRMAKIMESRLPGAVKKLESAWEGLKLAFSETPLFEALIEVPIGVLTQLFRGLTPELEQVNEEFSKLNRTYEDFNRQIKAERGLLEVMKARPDAETKRGVEAIRRQERVIQDLLSDQLKYSTESGLITVLDELDKKIKSVNDEIDKLENAPTFTKYSRTGDFTQQFKDLENFRDEIEELYTLRDFAQGKFDRLGIERRMAEIANAIDKASGDIFDTAGLDAGARFSQAYRDKLAMELHSERQKAVYEELAEDQLGPIFDQAGLDAGARFSQAYSDKIAMEAARGRQRASKETIAQDQLGPIFDQAGLDAGARFSQAYIDKMNMEAHSARLQAAKDSFAQWQQGKDPSEWVIALKNNFKELGREVSGSLRTMIQSGVEFNEILKRMALNLSLAFVERGLGEGGFIRKLITGRASGGPVSAGQPYVVGEKGPELIVPNYSGYVVPNHRMGGGEVKVETNITVNGNMDDAQIERITNEIATKVNRTRNRAQFMREARA